ncbi:MAG: hypothetical protein IKD88_08255 [Lachnospiraceae bacterium]|nr:hypothetical protein [Lachnospiraceae bacterium]MBR2738687.1 hypothetical protein [Lachnospiraceae bacterium]
MKTMAGVLAAVLFVGLLSALPGAASVTARAAAGDKPAHDKSVASNGDGTYQISLDVQGDADTTSSVTGSVNVLVIYDTSNSMYNTAATGSTGTRAQAAERVMYDFLTALFGKQTGDGSNIQVAFTTFSRYSPSYEGQQQTWTSTPGAITGHFNSTGSGVNLRYTSGTNWERAFMNANTSFAPPDDDPTFVIFMTDGAPTQTDTSDTGYANTDAGRRTCYEAAMDDALSYVGKGSDVRFYGIYAFGSEADYLDDLVYYANNGSEREETGGGTAPTSNYYNASDTSALQAAINAIFKDITETLGIGSVSINDGTTSNVTTTSGEIADLLDVDDSSFEYWITIPLVEDGFDRTDPDSGETVHYTVVSNGDGTATVTWPGGSETVTGTVSPNLRYRWTGANSLYDKAPPAASFDGSAVHWDLSSVGTLLDNVTYTVTFNVWPSQTTLDLIADMENDPALYDTLDPTIRQYLSRDGILSTNTGATLSYNDSRNDAGQQTVDYDTPPGVSTNSSELMAISKQWENELDALAAEEIELDVTRDGADCYTVPLNSGNSWNNEVHISVGILSVDGESVIMRTTGHDYTFAEMGEIAQNWQIQAPVAHPMMINGEVTMLIKVEDEAVLSQLEASAPESGSARAEVDGTTYYYLDSFGWYAAEAAEEGETISLTAVNERRSYLDITKVVDGDAAPADALFDCTATVTDPASADGNVWFSVRDGETLVTNTDEVTYFSGSGVQAELDGSGAPTGYYYAPSGSEVTIRIRAGWNLRFLNLSDETTYSISESAMPGGFRFVEAAGVRNFTDEGGNAASEAAGSVSGQAVSGSIDYTNSAYVLTFRNVHEASAASVTLTARKVLTGRDLQAGEFRFELRDAQGQVLQTATNAADGTISFESITYDVPGTYNYTIAEVPGNETGVTYDTKTFGVTVTVTENEGLLIAQTTYTDGTPVFSNIYVPQTPPVVPTGDGTNFMPYVLLALGAIAVCAGTLAVSRRRAR